LVDVSIGPGAESVALELFATATLDSRWDSALWDGGQTWSSPAWQPIECEVLEATYQSGASADAGVLSVPDAGAMDCRTYDPDRLLDPLAAGSPFFGSIRPGSPIRLVGETPTRLPAWTGYLDEARHELGSSIGRLRAVDGIAYLAQAEVPEGAVLPNTLRARVRAVVTAAGLDATVPVSPEVPDIDPDPAVAAHDGKARAAWSIIQDAGLDALTFVWLDPSGTLRFTPWGSLPDAAYSVGCDDGTGGAWLEGLAELESTAAADAIRNSVRWWASASTFGAAVTDAPSIRKYGERRLDAARIVPGGAVWAGRILADRADAGLEVTLGELRPYSGAELALLLDGASSGPAVLRVRDDDHGELVDLAVAIIGGAVGVTENGWRFRFTTAIPRAEWDEVEPPPPIPPDPPPAPYHTETRSYVATSDALIALTSGGAKYGAGAATTLPVGAWQGWTYRSLIQFPTIPFGGLRRIVSATLKLRTTTQVRVGFGSSPTIELKRITGAWSAGSASSPSSGNSVVWPGPAVTGSVRANTTAAESTAVSVAGVLSLVLPWAPTSLGGSLAAQRGLALYPGSGSGSDTTEFYPVEQGGTSRPQLDLVVEVFD
jgi:hypothetical protein